MRFLRSIIATAVDNPVLATMVTVCLVVGGIISARQVSREAFPPFSLDLLSIDVVYPGANPETVEEGITTKLEQAVEGIAGVREISSVAMEGLGTVYLTLLDGADSTEVLNEVKERVERLTTLPEEAKRPVVQERLVPHQVINVAVFGDVPERTLKQVAEEAHDDLIADPDISQINLVGARDEEVVIELSEPALQAYGLSFQQVMAAVAQSTLDLPAGVVRTSHEEIALRTEDRRTRAVDFEPLVVVTRPDQTVIRLGQIATVRDTFAETHKQARMDGKPAVMLEILKTDEEDTSTIARQVRRYVEQRSASLPSGLNMVAWADASRNVDDMMEMLIWNGLQGFGLVVLTLMLFFNLRLSFWVAMGLPVAFGGAFIVMGAYGMSANLITLFGLILVSGMIDDDAIVIAEQIHIRATELGEKPALAAIEGTSAVAMPVLAGVATTITAFVPLLFVSGVMGKFIRALPIVVIAAMVASTVESLTAMPAHLRHGERVGEGWAASAWFAPIRWLRQQADTALQALIRGPYRSFYRAALDYRFATVGIGLMMALITAGWVWGGHTPFILMGKVDAGTLRARVRFPEGTPASTTEAALNRIEAAANALSNDPGIQRSSSGQLVRHIFSQLGQWTQFVTHSGSHLGEVTLELMPAQERNLHSAVITQRWQKLIGTIPEALSCTITPEELGPTEKPVEIRLHGDDLKPLRAAADEVAAQLATYHGVRDIEDDLILGKRELQVKLKETARNLGLTAEDLAVQLRQGNVGGEAEHVQRGREEVVVRVRYAEEFRRSLGDLERIRLRTVTGAEIPFMEAAEVQGVQGYGALWHQDTRQRVRIWADVDEREANAERVVQDMTSNFLPELVKRHPGVTFSIAGQRAQISESLSSLTRGFLMSLVGIYAILAAMMRSYMQPLIIMAVIPLAQVGVVLGHAVMGEELTLLSVFGAVALSGIVVNNAIVLVDYINGRLAEGASVREAVQAAGESRFRPVVLTTLTTVVGILPVVFAGSTQTQTLVPMAIAVAFGLTVATALTLVVVPALYWAVNDAARAVYWLRHGGRYPSAEQVVMAHG